MEKSKMHADPRLIDLLKNEFEILRSSDHPHIVKIFDMYESETEYQILSELLSGAELMDYISMCKKFNEGVASKIMKQVVEAINFIHKQNIVHRDLKP